METPKKFTLSGEIRLNGGNGGVPYSSPSGGGGGASGGSALLRAGEWVIPLGSINSTGGTGGA